MIPVRDCVIAAGSVAGGGEVAELGTVAVSPAPVWEPVELPPLRHPDDAEDEGS